MTKKHFIALANALRHHQREWAGTANLFTFEQLFTLAWFCKSQNPRFNVPLWLNYIAGNCGPSGGKLKALSNKRKVTP